MSFATRLALLRRQAGAVAATGSQQPAAVAPPAAPRPAPVPAVPDAALLRRALVRRGVAPANRVTGPALPGRAIAPGVLYVEERFVWDDGLDALLPPRWPDGRAVARERFLCFDTETTGLAGGTGTRAFMIGAADWHAGMLRVRQLYLTALGGETAMLDCFAAWLAPERVLISYNGRCYDAPLLAARYRLARRANPLAGLAHVDLLHGVRRRYRGVWENCRLATVERELLRIVREDDLPGAEAPGAFLAYLRQGHTHDLARVLEHNRQDAVSLARLLQWLAGGPGSHGLAG